MSKRDFKFAVFIGRFQPPHIRHIEAMKHGLSKAETLIIVLGSARAARNIKNPFTPAEREEMVRSCFSQEENKRIVFRSVRDYYYNDNNWVADVQQKVASVTGEDRKICLLGRNKDHTSYYLDLFPQWQREQVKSAGELNATDVRNILFDRKAIGPLSQMGTMCDPAVIGVISNWIINNEDRFNSLYEEWDFIQSYKEQWKSAPYPVTFTTTDAVVVKSGHVLVVKRKFNPGKGLLALPGGFLQQNKTLFESALNELKEETRILIPKYELGKYLKEQRVFDHPGRSLRGRTVTHAFYFELPPGGDLPQVKGDDDAEHAMWIPIADAFARADEFYEDHLQIIQWFYGRGDNK
jgi:bifunctional NMN adenylyltransferase/nudix hydrolase